MDGEDNPIDGGITGLAVLGLIAVFVACVCGADWVRPPSDGAGPWVTPERLHTLKVAAYVVGAVVVLCIVRAVWGRTGMPMYTAAAAVGILAVLGGALLIKPPEARLSAAGFDGTAYRVATGTDLMFYNTTHVDLTVCLGVSGDCEAQADGPKRLRSPGLVIPADHRAVVTMPKRTGLFRLTIATPGDGITRRNATVEAYHADTGP